ncbi:MAG: hypothetical protein K2Y39_18200 [Candidatus Obscuribacterales bacterium]|nr:hypothetical protein [Candidatus Obscuribacterales bacterium]
MACDASPSNLVSSLEKWNEAKTAGSGDTASIENEIAQQLQNEYATLSSQALNSDPNRVKDMRENINAQLAELEASCNMPHMELIEINGGLRVVSGSGRDGFNVKIDESQAELAALSLSKYATQDTAGAVASDNAKRDASGGAKPCETSTPAEAPRPASVHKPIAKYVSGERPIAGGEKLTAGDFDAKMERDYHDNMVYKFKDGSSVKFDGAQPPRPVELTNARGERISLSYRAESKIPNSFIMTDSHGSVIESGFKGPRDREWNIDTGNANWKVKEAFRGAHITDIGVREDLQLVMRDRSGNFIEHRRDGDVLKRDFRGRITGEVTIVGRTTEFKYSGKDINPSAYTVIDGGGAIIEHAERKNHAWNVFRPKQGTTSLDPGNMNNPDNLVRNPSDKVASLQLNHRNGNAVMLHGNDDRTWRPGDDERLWRKTTGGAETITHPRDNGEPEMQHFVGTTGVKTRYEYDENGQVLKMTEHHPNGEINKLSRRDVSQDFVDEKGRRQKIEATHLADGSVRINWLERNSQIVQRPDGTEVHEFIAKDGRRRVHSTIDTKGTTTEFVYNISTGEPVRLKITDAKGNQDVWTIESPIKTGIDNPVWKNGDRTKTFEGSVSVERDGSVKYTGRDGRVALKTLRGVTLDVTPNPTMIQ